MTTPTGTPIDTLKEQKLGVLSGFIIELLVTALFIYMIQAPVKTDWSFWVSLILFAIATIFLGVNAVKPAQRLEIYSDGFILRRIIGDRVLAAALWAEITEISWPPNRETFSITRFLFPPSEPDPAPDGPTNNELYIHLPVRKITVNNTFFSGNRWTAGTLWTAIMDTSVSDIMNRLNSGATVTINRIELSSAGLRESGWALIEWASITDVSRIAGGILVRYEGRRRDMDFLSNFHSRLLIDIINLKLGKRIKLASLSERLGVL